MKIRELLDGIRTKDLVVPEFQREYVWSRDQAKQLMISLTKEYPIGSLLFWKTTDPPKLKNFGPLPVDKAGTYEVILDGQQRLTALYLLMRGDIPPYYTDSDLETGSDPRDLYFDLDDGEFQYYQVSRMKGHPTWCRVVDCFSDRDDIDVFEIAQSQSEDPKEINTLAQRYLSNRDNLINVERVDLPHQVIPSDAGLEQAIDIFDLANSRGTKLTDAELALTHVTGKWSDARRVLKAKIDDLWKQNFWFDLTVMTRFLTVVVCQRALFKTIHSKAEDEVVHGWNQLTKILDYLVHLLPESASIHSTGDLNTMNVLVPIVAYLSLHDGRFPNEKTLRNAIHFIYVAHTWARYTGQTSQRLEHDVLLTVRNTEPWELLREQIIDQRGRLDVTAADLEGRGAQHPLYKMLYMLSKARGAVDWFNGSPLKIGSSAGYGIHSHHIFPQHLLYSKVYDADSLMGRKKVNAIANRAFVTATTNLSLGSKPPQEYLPEVEEKYPGALQKQFIPMNEELWRIERYEDFLNERRRLISKGINEYLNALISEPDPTADRTASELIALGESLVLEFKTTLQWDVVQGTHNKKLRQMVIKSLAAFMNTEGGTLIVGVEDDGSVYGLEDDLKLLGKSEDKYSQLIASLVTDYIGPDYYHLVKPRFETVDNKRVWIADVAASSEPIFVKGDGGNKQFFLRVGNTTQGLDPEATVNYVDMHWT